MKNTLSAAAAVLLGLTVASGCAPATQEASPAAPPTQPTVVQPGAPGEASRAVTPGEARGEQIGHTEADVRFMQMMIAHHAQALEMTELARDRAGSQTVLNLAARIEAGQADEIALMRSWLEKRGEDAPDPLAHHGHGHHDPPAHHPHHHHQMPGMLSPEQLGRLAAAEGDEFDRLFLELMIFHHQGAIVMVEELFASHGAGQESEIYQFASHVDSDQSMEIARMWRILQDLS